MKNTKTIVIALVVVAAGLIGWYLVTPGSHDAFAACLEDEGAIFYGAYWCSHCEDQKAMFGKSEKFLPYVECSLPNRGGQTEECIDAGIQGYPTWEFADGERISGVVSFKELAEKTGCPLP